MVRNAPDLLKFFSLRVTGASCGDVLTGCAKGSKGGLIQLVGKPDGKIGPIKSCLEMMKDDEDVWKGFLEKLTGVKGYGGMGREEREKKVWEDAEDVSTNLPVAGGSQGLRIRVLSLPQTIVERVSEQDMENILSKTEGWDVHELLSTPGLTVPGSTKPSLVFLTGWWKITTDTTLSTPTDFDGVCVDLLTGSVYSDPLLAPNHPHIYTLSSITNSYRKTGKGYVREGDGETVGVLLPDLDAKKKPGFEVVGGVKKRLDAAFEGFGNGVFKSTLQKIIRYAPNKVTLPDGGDPIDPVIALRYVFSRMRDSSGQFVPDIQRWVGGVESLGKRGAVVGFEDSNPLVDTEGVASMMIGAVLAQRVPSWKPGKIVQEKWMTALEKLYKSKEAVVYDIKKGFAVKPFTLPSATTPLQTASALLDELRSFPSDLSLTRHTASLKKPVLTSIKTNPPVTMPLPDHAIDQHVNPNIVYLFPMPFSWKVGPPGAPFKFVLGEFFTKVTGVNPRREDTDGIESRPFVTTCRGVQKLFRKLLQVEAVEREVIGSITVTETVDVSWVAGMVGVINVGKVDGVMMVVTMDVGDPLKLVAVRAPARGASDNMLSDAERQEEAKKRAKEMLKKGLPMNKIPPPHPSLSSCVVYLNCDAENNPECYEISTKHNKTNLTPWNTLRELSIELPIHPKIVDGYGIENAMRHKGKGVEVGWEATLQRLFDESVEVRVLRRLLVYVSDNKTRIKMNNVSRDGGGTEGAVLIDDVGVYEVLMKMSLVVPSAVSPVKGHPFSFEVKSLPMLWKVRRVLVNAISSKKPKTQKKSLWPNIDDKLRRITMQHQNEALASLKSSHKRNLHGAFLYIPPGMGKTLIVMLYLRWLAAEGRLPPYVVYTLPKSAMKSVLFEITALGMPVTVVRPVKSKQVVKEAKEVFEGVDKDLVKVVDSKEMHPGRVMMVEHDDLRNCEDALSSLATEGFIFINDEVHKTLATTTKRTSVALSLAALSHEFIALTGTPIISSSAYPLIGWLQRISPFTVTGNNFWVSANTMIAHTVATGVATQRESKTPTFTKHHLLEYLKKVPPAFICQDVPGKNPNPKPEDWRVAAGMCYDLCDVGMVDEAVEVIEDGVMVVVRDKSHQKKIVKMLLEKGVGNEKIFALGGDSKGPVAAASSIFLTSQSVKSDKTPPYKIVVVPVRMAEGYSLTYLTRYITSVYPCNNSTREQLEGRINRISQEAKKVYYTVYHCGVLSWIRENHLKAHDLSTALKSMAKVVDSSNLKAVTKNLE